MLLRRFSRTRGAGFYIVGRLGSTKYVINDFSLPFSRPRSLTLAPFLSISLPLIVTSTFSQPALIQPSFFPRRIVRLNTERVYEIGSRHPCACARARARVYTRARPCEGSGTPTSIRYRRLRRSKKTYSARRVPSSGRWRISSAGTAPSSRRNRLERTPCSILSFESAVIRPFSKHTHARSFSLSPSHSLSLSLFVRLPLSFPVPLSHVSYRRLVRSPPPPFSLLAPSR